MFKSHNFENEQKLVTDFSFKDEIPSPATMTIPKISLFTYFPTVHSSPIGYHNSTETASSHQLSPNCYIKQFFLSNNLSNVFKESAYFIGSHSSIYLHYIL